MSLLIGVVRRKTVDVKGKPVDRGLAIVHASRSGVEIASEPDGTLTPEEAREYAAHLMRGADTSERMRVRSSGLGEAAASVAREMRGLSAKMPSSVRDALQHLEDELERGSR